MQKRATSRPHRRIALDRSIERVREHLARLATLIAHRKFGSSLEEFDQDAERLISEVFGEASPALEAYELAEIGESSSLVNLPEEAQEGGTKDVEQASLHLRRRVLESCIAELEARRAEEAKKPRKTPQLLIGPQVADFMTPQIRSVSALATLNEAGRLMQEYKVGSLLVTDKGEYVGVITDTDLARDVVARGLDSSTTTVKACMRTPPITIEGSQPIIQAVRLMKDKATRHLAVTEERKIVGIISVSNILRYYSGVV